MFAVAQVLGERYHIQYQWGHNCGWRTLLAQDFQTQSLVVLKILAFNSDFHWEDLKRFKRGAETVE